jgi:hypothetical protein
MYKFSYKRFKFPIYATHTIQKGAYYITELKIYSEKQTIQYNYYHLLSTSLGVSTPCLYVITTPLVNYMVK